MNFKLFKNLPPESKLWVFAADQSFSREQNETIYKNLTGFVNEWSTHGVKNDTEFYILYNRIVLIAASNADCGGASGCSIDSLNNFMKKLGNDLNLNFFNRMQILYLDTEKHTGLETLSEHVYSDIISTDLQALTEKFANKEIDENTKVINLAVSTVSGFYNDFVQPVKKTWIAKHLLTEA